MSYKAQMNGGGESYSGIVPTKRSNEGQGGPKEIVEGRPLTKENAEAPNPNRTPSREYGPSGLDRVRQAAKQDKEVRFTALLHHVSVDLLRSSYYSLKRRAAAGVDGMTWAEYGETWRSGSPTCMDESIEGDIGRNRHGESGSRKAMEGNDHWESRRWKTKSYSER
jgi:hypothetical protein